MAMAQNVSFFKVILHNRNTYLPGFHTVFGSDYLTSTVTDGLNVNSTQVCTVAVLKTVTNYVDKGGGRSCQSEGEVNVERCVADYINLEVGCR